MKTPETVDEYLMQFPEETQLTLEKVRAAIRSACPQAEEVISYMMPMYKFNGMLVGFGAAKNHCAFYVCNNGFLTTIKNDLHGYEWEGSTIRFPHNKAISSTLVKRIVKLRMAENDINKRASTTTKAKSASKSKSTPKPKANKTGKNMWFKQ
jgi:uncharacterized protein YdhG (YjbR/CyaY superfamily)